MSRRSRAREVAFQVLYQDDLNPGGVPGERDRFLRRRLDSESYEFARDLVAGCRKHRAEIDALLENTAEHWALGRMTATDRNILRLGAYELMHTETPERVVVDEAVELAKRYGTARSSQFVNGILDRLMKKTEENHHGTI